MVNAVNEARRRCAEQGKTASSFSWRDSREMEMRRSSSGNYLYHFSFACTEPSEYESRTFLAASSDRFPLPDRSLGTHVRDERFFVRAEASFLRNAQQACSEIGYPQLMAVIHHQSIGLPAHSRNTVRGDRSYGIVSCGRDSISWGMSAAYGTGPDEDRARQNATEFASCPAVATRQREEPVTYNNTSPVRSRCIAGRGSSPQTECLIVRSCSR